MKLIESAQACAVCPCVELLFIQLRSSPVNIGLKGFVWLWEFSQDVSSFLRECKRFSLSSWVGRLYIFSPSAWSMWVHPKDSWVITFCIYWSQLAKAQIYTWRSSFRPTCWYTRLLLCSGVKLNCKSILLSSRIRSVHTEVINNQRHLEQDIKIIKTFCYFL